MSYSDYRIVSATRASEVEVEVRRLLAEGWVPCGDLVIDRSPPSPSGVVTGRTSYHQAMALPDAADPPSRPLGHP